MADGRDSIQVLHIDDDPDFAGIVAEFLHREDDRLVIETALSADAGLERIAGNKIDCVVSDYDMPGMDGIALLETVRSDHPELPFILYTGKGSEEVASEAISKGVTDYLQKESGTDQYTVLANRVTNAVEKAWAERDADRIRSHLNAIVGNTHDAIITINRDSTVVFANPAIEDLLGYSPDDIEGESLTTLMPPRYHEDHTEAMAHYLETGEQTLNWQSIEFHARHRDGHEIPVSISFGEFEQDGEQRFVGIMRDISNRIRTEAELREREERFRQMAENIVEVVWMTDPEKSEMIYVNPAYQDIWGRSVESLYEEPESFLDAIHDEDRDRVDQALDEQITGEYDEEYRIVRPDGEVRWIRDRAVPVTNDAGDVYRIVGIASDITERVERERELERYERLVEAMGDAVYSLDPDGYILEVNERLETLTGYDREALLGEHVSLMLDEEDVAKGERTVKELRSADDKRVGTYEETVHTADGGSVRCEVRQTLLPSADGEFLGTVGTIRDITDRTERERELERYEMIVRAFPDEVYTLDPDGRFTSIVPPAGEETTVSGYTPEELIGEHVSVVMDETDIADGESIIQALIESETDQTRSFEMDVITKDGDRIPHEIHIALLPSDDGFRGTVGVLRDISQRTERERQLHRRNERLDEFASVVSHDLQNPLSVAMGQLELVREECDSDHLDPVARAHQRMETLIADLLTLAREGETVDETEPIELAALVDKCWSNIDTAAAALINETEGVVRADPGRLQQVLENLIRNAVTHGGENVTVTVGDLAEGFYVADDGPGIPEDERDQVFDAGYSTGEEGTGFGLRIVKQIVEAHGREIQVTEGSAGGARFEITDVERTS